MTEIEQQSGYHFDIHPSVVFRLGDELISDEVQALVELIKNSYDADATFAKVVIDTKNTFDGLTSYTGRVGFITIEDNGVGMTKDVIQNGWLFISNSAKRNMKDTGETTKRYGRTPQGDKGLGRLGTQRLGYNLEIVTRPENKSEEYNVAFSWRDFLYGNRLTTIPIKFSENSTLKKPGTNLLISDLRNIEIWEGVSASTRLQTELSRLISPFKKIRNFRVELKINGVRIDLAEIAEEIKKTSQLQYHINFDGSTLLVKGSAKLDYFNPTASDRDYFDEFVRSDNGESLRNYILNKKKSANYNIVNSTDSNWYVEYHFRTSLKDLDGLVREQDGIVNPGPFEGEVDFFDFNEGAGEQNIFNRRAEYRQYIKDLSGIKVYRDGFGIRVDSDWLNLRSEATSGRSRYVLRPDSTIGYISITADENPHLRETTSREGFINNAYYKNFYSILRRFVKFTGDVQNYIRRSWLEFRNIKIKETKANNVENNDTSSIGITSTIQKDLEEANEQRKNLQTVIDNIEKISDSTENNNSKTNVKDVIIEAQKVMIYLDNLSSRVELPRILSLQFKQLQEQITSTYETMSLGLTAEALTHEIGNITQQLAERNEDLNRYLKRQNISDPIIFAYIEYVRNSISALLKQMSHFTPSLKYVRQKKEQIRLISFFNDMKDFYTRRFTNKNISVEIISIDDKDFSIYMNRGKITQIFDNVFLNSEYWLTEDIRTKVVDNGIVSVEINEPYVRIYDNGRGIDPTVEHTLFDPFITTKKDDNGRGLGLFIIQQLLDSESCTIELSSKRNSSNRLYIFEVNLTNRIH